MKPIFARVFSGAFALVLATGALGVGGAGCKARRPTSYVNITIVAAVGESIPGIALFRSALTNDGETDVTDFNAPGGDYVLSDSQGITYTADVRRRTGGLDILVEALDSGGTLLGAGMASSTIEEPLDDEDFVGNVVVRVAATGMMDSDSGTDAGADGGGDSGPPLTCGDGVIDDGEECDDGNMNPDDYCDGCTLHQLQAETTTGVMQAAEPRVVMRDNGGFYVIWSVISGLDHEVLGRRFDALGVPIDATETTLHTASTLSEDKPDVAMDPSTGELMAVWQSCEIMPPQRCDVFARLFDAAGAPVVNTITADDSEFMVNVATTDSHRRPSVARRPGGYVVAWEAAAAGASGGEIFARLHAGDGTPLTDPSAMTGTDPFPVRLTAAEGCWPTVEAGSDGVFVVVWGASCSGMSDLDATEIRARLFPATGAPAGVFLPTDDGLGRAGPYRTASVSFATNDNFFVVWEAADGNDSNIDAVVYDVGGIVLGPVDVSGASTPGIDRRDPRVGYNPGDGAAGLFVVGWRETSGTGALTSLGLHTRLVHPSGTTILTSFPVEPTAVAMGEGPSPRVVDTNGSLTGFWVVAWRSPSGVTYQLFPVGHRP